MDREYWKDLEEEYWERWLYLRELEDMEEIERNIEKLSTFIVNDLVLVEGGMDENLANNKQRQSRAGKEKRG